MPKNVMLIVIFLLFKVIKLVSPTFNYNAYDRAKARSKQFATERFPDTIGKHMRAGLPPKVNIYQYSE